ncbi:MAG: thioredoxin family protein [Geminicoccaceae bacterium]
MRRFAFVLLLAGLLPLSAQAVEMGEDGLHKEPWLALTFKDMAEDLQTANDDGRRLAIIFEQRGCIYCRKMHEEVFSDPKIRDYIEQNFMVVQMNLFGDEEVTDFDGEALPEKEMAKRWGVVFTPTMLFMPKEVPDGGTAAQAAVEILPGAFGKGTTMSMLRWVNEELYEGEEHFQKYHARRFMEEEQAQ